jgi:hypothetical protein
VSSGTDFAKIDNIMWKDYNGTVGSVAPAPRQRVPNVPALTCRDGVLSVGGGAWDRLDIVAVDGRVVAHRQRTGQAVPHLRLAPGTYMAIVSGTGGSWTGGVAVH